MKTLRSLCLTVAIALAPVGYLAAQTTSADVAQKELELKQKELDLEKAKLEAAKAQQLSVQSAQVDLEQQKLELAKARQALAIKETNDRLTMALSGDVLFDTNQAVIKPNAKDTLINVATILAAYPGSRINVTGYTDNRGGPEMNMKLSRDRAEAVKTWLLSKSDISSDRIFTEGAGETDPVATNETAAGRQENRRVDIAIIKTVPATTEVIPLTR